MITYHSLKKYFKGTRCHVLSIFVLAFLIRLFLVWYILGLDWRYNTGGGYENAVFWEHVLKKSCYMPPGQYLFAGLINQFFSQPNYLLLRIATILLSSLVSVNIYKIGIENYGHNAGIISGYFSIVSLPFIFQSWTFYGTTLATCLFSFFILYFFRILKHPEEKNVILAGISLGLSALTRAETLIFFPLAFLWFIVVKGIGGDSLRIVIKMVVISLLVILCWTVRNYFICNKFVLVSSNGQVNFFIGNNPIQKGGYFTPIASKKEKENYLLSGLIYDLEHPGWFIKFFKEKFKLYWSTRTGEHPKRLLESRFNKSTVRLFNDKFEKSRLNGFIQNHKLDGLYEFLVFLYSYLIGVFWFFIFLGLIYAHLFWQKSYFIIGICFTHALFFSLFFSGANRFFVPMLPYLYIVMGLGIIFIYKIPRLKRAEISLLLSRSAFLLLVLIVSYTLSLLLTCHPVEKKEKIRDLHNWNVLSVGKESVRLIILESQLSYPVKKDSLASDSFSVWVAKKEIPHLKIAGEKKSDDKFCFRRVKDLLCKNAFSINLPHTLMNVFLSERKSNDKKVTVEKIVKSLNGKITVQYVPAWQFRSWIENIIKYLLRLLRK